jgi:hypothetical protein
MKKKEIPFGQLVEHIIIIIVIFIFNVLTVKIFNDPSKSFVSMLDCYSYSVIICAY